MLKVRCASDRIRHVGSALLVVCACVDDASAVEGRTMSNRAFAVWLWCGATLTCATWFVFGYTIGRWS